MFEFMFFVSSFQKSFLLRVNLFLLFHDIHDYEKNGESFKFVSLKMKTQNHKTF